MGLTFILPRHSNDLKNTNPMAPRICPPKRALFTAQGRLEEEYAAISRRDRLDATMIGDVNYAMDLLVTKWQVVSTPGAPHRLRIPTILSRRL